MIANRKVDAAGRAQLAQFRCLRRRAEPRRLRPTMNIADQAARIRREAMRIAGKRVETDERDRGAQSLQRTRWSARCRRRGPSTCARPSPRPRPSSRSSPATSASRSCSGPPSCCATARRSSPASSRRSPACAGRTRSTRRAAPTTSVPSPAQLTIKDDGEIYACDISPQGKQRKIFTTRLPLLGVISAITPFNHPLNMVCAQARAGDRHQQPRGAEADRADAADGAGARRRALRGGPAAGDAVGRDRQSVDDGRRHDHRSGLPTSITFTGSVRVGKHIADEGRLPAASCSSSAATIR